MISILVGCVWMYMTAGAGVWLCKDKYIKCQTMKTGKGWDVTAKHHHKKIIKNRFVNGLGSEIISTKSEKKQKKNREILSTPACEWSNMWAILTRPENSLESIGRNGRLMCKHWVCSGRHNYPNRTTWFRFVDKCHSHELPAVLHRILDKHHDLRRQHTSIDPLQMKMNIFYAKRLPLLWSRWCDVPTDFGDSNAPVELYVREQWSHGVNGTSKNCMAVIRAVCDSLPQPITVARLPTIKFSRSGYRQIGCAVTKRTKNLIRMSVTWLNVNCNGLRV